MKNNVRFKNDLEKQYDSFASDFSTAADHQDEVSINAFRNAVGKNLKGKKILDMGCGNGNEMQYLAQHGADVFGIDASSELINIAKQKFPKFHFKTSTFNNIPYEKESFDIIVSRYAFQHAPYIDDTYLEVLELLKTGGKFVFLATHPIRSFIEKRDKSAIFSRKKKVDSLILNGALTVQEYSYDFNEYFSNLFFQNFQLLSFTEAYDPAAEKINSNIYPGFMVISALKK